MVPTFFKIYLAASISTMFSEHSAAFAAEGGSPIQNFVSVMFRNQFSSAFVLIASGWTTMKILLSLKLLHLKSCILFI